MRLSRNARRAWRSVGASAHGLLRGIAGGSGEAKPSADDERLKAFWERMDLPSPRERLFVQTFARSTRDELLEVGMRHVVSTHEIKASLLALGVAQPGAIALVVALEGKKCRLTDVGGSPLGPFELKDCVHLDLSARALGDSGAKELAAALKTNSKLETLDLYFNYIRDEGAIALADALRENSKLTKLTMESNSIGNEGATALGEMLKINKGLKGLYLKHNDISDLGAVGLAAGLKMNSVLTTLYLRRNSVDNEGAAALAEALKSSACTSLNLRRNRVGDEGALALVAALPSTKVSTLDLRYNDYTDKGKGALAGGASGGRKVLATEPEKDAGKWRGKGGKDGRKMKPMKVQRGKRRPSAGAF